MAALIGQPSQSFRGIPAPHSGGLDGADFRLTAPNGFGDGWNSYAHSMAWFEGKLYVGTTRATMAGLKYTVPDTRISPWPTNVPDDVYSLDRRAEIWCYTVEQDRWTRVYKAAEVHSTMIKRLVPRYVGFRGMTVFQGAGDTKPCIYVATWAPWTAEPPNMLRSEDGIHFEDMPRPPFGDAVRSFRTTQVFKGRLHTTPTSSNIGGIGRDSVGSDATIFCSADIASGEWARASDNGFGDLANLTVFEMGVFNDHLYAGCVNAQRGFELWKTDGEGGPPYRWKKVLERGAHRGPFNEAVVSLMAFKGALYVGTGIINGGYHREYKLGPAAAEILRVWPDDTWDLLVGQSRLTPDGLKYPLSGYSAGFDNLFAGYFWRQMVHDGHLYVGSFSWANMLPYLYTSIWPEEIIKLMKQYGMEYLTRERGGFQLWRTHDGVHWEAVTRNGFGNKFNWGVRNYASTPHGLFVGTANPFGPEVASFENGRWSYVENQRGGCEIWLGSKPLATPAGPR